MAKYMTNREALDLYESVRYNLTHPRHKEAVDAAFAALVAQKSPRATEGGSMKFKDPLTKKEFDDIVDAVNFFCDGRNKACEACPLSWERFSKNSSVAGCSMYAMNRSPINVVNMMGYDVIVDPPKPYKED